MEGTYSKLNSTQNIVVKLLQQLVTECTDQVLATQPLYSLPEPPAGYRVIQPSPFNSVLILEQVNSKHLQHMASTDRSQSLPTSLHLKVCFALAGYRAFLPFTNQHQESTNPQGFLPAGHSSSAAYSPGLRLMTGLIMCSP